MHLKFWFLYTYIAIGRPFCFSLFRSKFRFQIFTTYVGLWRELRTSLKTDENFFLQKLSVKSSLFIQLLTRPPFWKPDSTRRTHRNGLKILPRMWDYGVNYVKVSKRMNNFFWIFYRPKTFFLANLKITKYAD